MLIALHAAAVCAWDAEVRNGTWWPGWRRKFPLVLGTDGAGVVAAKGALRGRFRIGGRVWAINTKRGFYAEYVVANAQHAGRVPRRLDLLHAAAAAATGWSPSSPPSQRTETPAIFRSR